MKLAITAAQLALLTQLTGEMGVGEAVIVPDTPPMPTADDLRCEPYRERRQHTHPLNPGHMKRKGRK